MVSTSQETWRDLLNSQYGTASTPQVDVPTQKSLARNIAMFASALGSIALGITHGSSGSAMWNDFGSVININVVGRASQIQLVKPRAPYLHRTPPRSRRVRILDLNSKPHVDAIKWIKRATGLSDAEIAQFSGVSRQAIYLWSRGSAISKSHLGRLLAVQDILMRATRSRKDQHSLVAWLNEPRGAEGITPSELLKGGQFDRARMLAASIPTPGLPRPPVWVTRHIPEMFRDSLEHKQEAAPLDSDELIYLEFGDGDDDDDDDSE